jgi:hypothetical protein
MNKANEKKKPMARDDGAPIELATVALNNEEWNDQELVTGIDVDVWTEQTIDEDVHVQPEPAAITLNNEKTNFQRQRRSKDVGVSIELTAIGSDDKETNDWREVTSENSKIKNRLLHMLHWLSLNFSRKETLGQRQLVVPVADSDNAADNPMTKNHRIVEVIEEPTVITTNNINDIKADFSPIIEYAEEPLLPLSEACFPLINILHNLLFYVQMALDETSQEPPDGLTIDESAAIRLYTIEWTKPHRSLYSMLNHALRNTDREELRPYFKYMKLFLTALAKLPCVPPSTVWRGVTKNVSADFPAGTPVTWWAFSSCTTKLTVLENNIYLGNTGNRTLFSVEAINGRTVRAHSHFVTEDEILLLPGTHMIVQSQLSPASDLHVIHLKQVVPKEVLLEPPFEGIFNIFNQLFNINTVCILRCMSLSKS